MTHEDPDFVRWVEWGVFDVGGRRHGKTEEGKIGVGKDIRVIGLEVTEWKERKGHTLKPSMITGVYDRDIHTLVIGAGVQGAIDCSDDVISKIKDHGVAEVLVLRTPEACRAYCELLRKGTRAALLAHATC